MGRRGECSTSEEYTQQALTTRFSVPLMRSIFYRNMPGYRYMCCKVQQFSDFDCGYVQLINQSAFELQ